MKIAAGLVAAMLLGLVAPKVHGFPVRQCKHGCRDAVHRCMDYGMRRARCQRAYWRACKRVGFDACSLQSTTTTLPESGTSTTTIPSSHGSLHLTIGQASRLDRDSMFCTFQLAVTGVGNSPVSLDPHHFYVMGTDGVRYGPLAVDDHGMGMMTHDCSADDVVPPNGTVVCSVQFTMPLWMHSGDVWFDDGDYEDHVPFAF